MTSIGAKLPTTHFFVYNGNDYPFNLQLFICFSDYMKNNQQKFQKCTHIHLLNESENMNLTERSIQDFICYCQNQVISINNQNAISLNKLAQKYEVVQLIDSTKQYIINHHDELLFEIYAENLNHNFTDNFDYEKAISDHISDYISNGKLITLPLSSIYRILSLNDDTIDNTEIYKFLLDCLKKYEKEASVLFTCIDLDKAPTHFVSQLLTDYADKIDLNYIKCDLLKSLHQQQLSIMQKQREQDLLISELKSSLIEKQQIIDKLIESEKKKNIQVIYVVPLNYMNNSINVNFIDDLNTKDIQIYIRKIDENAFNDLIRNNPNYIRSFDVVMLGVNGYDLYLSKTDDFFAILAKYRDDGGHILFLHDFNSAERSKYKKPVQPFSDDLGFRTIVNGQYFKKCKFIPNKCDELSEFPFKINLQDNAFDISETHETPTYDPMYTIIKDAGNDQVHYYCENSEKRVGDTAMGHSIGITFEEKKLLYNILYHLSQLP